MIEIRHKEIYIENHEICYIKEISNINYNINNIIYYWNKLNKLNKVDKVINFNKLNKLNKAN